MIRKFPIELYGGVLHVVVTNDFVAEMDKHKLRGRAWDADNPADFDADWAGVQGVTFSSRPVSHVVWVLIKPKAPAHVLAHEAVHCANFVMLGLGEEWVSTLRDEMYARLVDWFVEKMCEALKA